MLIMKNLLILIFLTIGSQVVVGQNRYLRICDAITGREFENKDGVIVTITESLSDLTEQRNGRLVNLPDQNNINTLTFKYPYDAKVEFFKHPSSVENKEHYFPIPYYPDIEDNQESFIKKLVIEVNASGYEKFSTFTSYRDYNIAENTT
jgi:hypothetical protein